MSVAKAPVSDLLGCLRTATGIAVIGASADVQRPGGRLIAALKHYRFSGAIYPVNPGRQEIQGLPCYAKLCDVPTRPEIAFIVVASDAVPAAIAECVDLGVDVALVGSAGFSETGAAGLAAQNEIARVARAGGMRLLGPNTNGLVCVSNGLVATFSPALQRPGLTLRNGRVAMISQSGALGAAAFALAQLGGLSVGTMINTGNEADLGFEELLAALAGPDAETDVILGYMEGLSNAEAFVSAARDAAKNGTIIALLKVGRSPRGAVAAAAHTAKLSGQDRVFDGVFRQLGVARAQTLAELIDLGQCAAGKKPISGTRLTVASLSGGLGIIVADAVDELGLELAEWSDDWQRKLDDSLPSYLGRSNPIDLGGGPFWNMPVLSQIITILDRNPDSDITMLAIANFEGEQDKISEALIAVSDQIAKPLVVVWFGDAARARTALNSAGIPAYAEPVEAVRAIATLASRSPSSMVTAARRTPDSARQAAISQLLANNNGSALDADLASKVLATYDIPVVHQIVMPVFDDANIDELPCPAFLKLVAPKLSHKSDVGGVELVESQGDYPAALDRLRAIATKLQVTDAELVAQQRVAAGSELLLGMAHDPVFGPVVTLGLGGVLAEALDDVVVRLPYLDQSDVTDMLGELRNQPLLRGFRHLPSVDVPKVAEIVLQFAQLVQEVGNLFEAIDLNPIIVGADGSVTAVDMLLIPSAKA